MHALKWRKQLVGVGHVKAGTVVLDVKDRVAISIRLLPETDACDGLAGAEFPGVAQQIFHQLTKQAMVAGGTKPGLDLRLQNAGRIALTQRCQHLSSHRAEVHGFAEQGFACQLGQRQQGVNQLAHLHNPRPDALQKMPALADLRVRQAFHRHLDQAGKTIDSAQRCAQVVRHRITEGLQLLVGQLELGRAPLDAVLQAGVQVADLQVGF